MVTLVREMIPFMWLYIIYQLLFIRVCVKKMKKEIKRKKIIYIFKCIILLRVRLWT